MKFTKKHAYGIVSIILIFVLFSLVPTAIQEEVDTSVRSGLAEIGFEERSAQNWIIILLGFTIATGAGIGIVKFFG